MEKIRVEYDGPVGAVGNGYGLGARTLDKGAAGGNIPVIFFEVPVQRRGNIPNYHATARGIEIGVVRRNPEIDIDRGFIGVNFNSAQPAVIFECPQIAQRMSGKD